MLTDHIESDRKWRADPTSSAAISSARRSIATHWLPASERVREPNAESEPRIVGAVTVNLPLESTPSQTLRLREISKSPKWRARADRWHSDLLPAFQSDADGSGANGSLGVPEELLSRLLVDEAESLSRLYNIVSKIGLRILFFDEKRKIVGSYGNATKSRNPAEFAKSPEETSQGTFDSEYRPTTVRNCPASISRQIPSLSCLAAPIFDAEGGLLGFLDVMPTNGDLTGKASTLAGTVMQTTARAIEERLFRKRYRREWIIALASPDGGGRGMLLASDGQQRIVGADRCARSTLSANKLTLGDGSTLWAFFEKDSAPFRNRNAGDICTALVSVGGAKIWAAIITPPESAALRQHNTDYTTLHCRPRLDSIGCFRRAAPPASSVGGLTPQALQRIREYIEANLTESIELETLAEIAGLSKWHFARAFKQSVGTPPHLYLIQRRLQRAQELIAETDLSLALIALKSGFSDQSHFSRRFVMLFGVTPRSFRRSKR